MPRQVKPIYYDDNIRNTFIRYGGTDQRAKYKEIEKFLILLLRIFFYKIK